MTEPMMIEPYWSDDLSTWAFDDPAVGLRLEPFVSGAPAIITLLVQDITNARDGFRLIFSDAPFPGFQRSMTLIREENGGGRYGLDNSTMEGWLCPMLFRYFTEAPMRLYAKAEPRRK
jgi:hypothetical protein